MKEKMKSCPVCGKEMAASAAVCPSCGAKNKKPIFKRWWFWVVAVLAVGGIVSAMGGGGTSGEQTSAQPVSPPAASTDANKPEASEPSVTYAAYTVRQLIDDLNGNALKAENTYKDQYVEISGTLNVIDSSGKYISLRPSDDEFAIIGVQCYLKSEEQKQKVMELSVGDSVTVRGKITSVGEVLGYSLDIDTFLG